MPTCPEKFVAQKPKRNIGYRPGSTSRGYTSKWQVASRAYLRKHPLCRQCEARGVIVAAQCVDHIAPHRGDKKLFWNRDNWQPLCFACHNRKTGKGG